MALSYVDSTKSKKVVIIVESCFWTAYDFCDEGGMVGDRDFSLILERGVGGLNAR